MQVTHVNDHVTHAVIGGQETIEFGISSSAEFFNILSSTLYSDQILAVVREVLCNAWDAHIAADRKHIPVRVRITDDHKFIVEDSGFGIPHDLIGRVYGTYGNSTKKNDGMQTGGFGLGCKAPFAYTDHFEVVSASEGTKTIYALSKSSAQAQGKPGITPIASFPSEDTGLTVTISIKPSDVHRFDKLVRRLARYGDMNVTLNDEVLHKLGMPADSTYMLLEHSQFDGMTTSGCMVRYGNVVYPIAAHEKLNEKMRRVESIAGRAARGYNAAPVVLFQAKPHSIAVTPSRESLSMQEHTIKAIDELLDIFIKDFNRMYFAETSKAIKEAADTAAELVVKAKSTTRRLLSRNPSFPVDLPQPGYKFSSMPELARAHLAFKYPNRNRLIPADVEARVQAMLKAGIGNKRLLLSFLKGFNSYSKALKVGKSKWFNKYVIQRGIDAVQASNTGLLDVSRLYVIDSPYYVCRKEFRYAEHGYSGSTDLYPFSKISMQCHQAALPYLSNKIVLSTNKDFWLRLRKHEAMKNQEDAGLVFYYVGRKSGEAAAAKDAFTKAGYEVIDLTVRYSWDDPIPEKKPVVTPRKKGFPCLSAIGTPHGVVNTQNAFTDDATRIEEPEFYEYLSKNSYGYRTVSILDRTSSAVAIRLFGSKGAVVYTPAQKKKVVEKGIPEMEDYIKAKVVAYIKGNPRIEEYWANSVDRIEREASEKFDLHSYVSMFWTIPEFRHKLKLVNNLTSEDKDYLALFKCLTFRFSSGDLADLQKKLDSIPIAKRNTDLLKKISEHPLLQWIDLRGLNTSIVCSDDAIKRVQLVDAFVEAFFP